MLAADTLREDFPILTPSVIVLHHKTIITVADFILGDCCVNPGSF